MTNPNDHVPTAGNTPQLDAELQREIDEALDGQSVEQLLEEASRPPAQAAGQSEDDKDARGTQRIAQEMARGRIAAIRGDDVFVELTGLGGKNQGVVPILQFERPPRIGSIMDFVIQRFDEAEGLMILSREGAITRATWEQLQRGTMVEARVMAHNKGGLELEMVGGIRAFMPASQIDLHHVDELEQFVGQRLQAVVQEIDRRSTKVVISRRQFLEQERLAKQKKVWEEIEIGQVREGTISSLMEYGAFVDLGGVDGLIHISDMSYTRIDKPQSVVSVGQKVQVKVLKLDKEKNRISLGLKQTAPDPWESALAQIKPHEQVSGRVTRIADFGAFVEVLPGVEGLLPISEMSWRRTNKVGDVVKEGDMLRLLVLNIDPAKRRLSLSLKQSSGDPWVGAQHKYPKSAVIEATVLSTADFGAFMELEPGIEGLVHISELSDKRVNVVTDVVQVGQKHQVRILEVDEDNRRIRLSLKAAKETEPRAVPAEQPAATAAGAATAAKAAAKPKKPGKPLKGGMEGGGALGVGLRQFRL